MNSVFQDFAAVFQFLTRLPLNRLPYRPGVLSRAAKFFPLVGLALGAADAGIYLVLTPHLPVVFVALLIVLFSTLITGGLHEDGLADAADGLGGGWNKEKALAIMKDSRIGTYGALAIVFSVVGRVLLLSHLPAADFVPYAISAEVLCRWTVLPLGMALPGASEQASQGTRLARRISVASLLTGTLFALAIVGSLLHWSMWKPVVAAAAVTLLSGIYYKKRIDGVTGDCFGATAQFALVAVYLCGVWRA